MSEGKPDIPVVFPINGSLEGQIIHPRRNLELVTIEETVDGRYVDVIATTEKDEKKSLNELILPIDEPPWRIREGRGQSNLSSERQKHEIVIPSYVIMNAGETSSQGYRQTHGSKIAGNQYMEAHNFLSLDGAGISLLHEIGHAHNDRRFEACWNSLYKFEENISNWSENDYNLFKNVLIEMEKNAWSFARKTYYKLKREDLIDLEPNLDDYEIEQRIRYALGSYLDKIAAYEALKNK